MSDARPSRAPLVLAAVLGACALLVLAALILAAASDHSAAAWTGRWLGFAMAAATLGLATVIPAVRGSAGTHYWGMLTALALAALLAGAYSYRPAPPEGGKRTLAIPKRIGDWAAEGEDKADEETKRILQTDDMIMRTYQRGSDRVMLAVVFAVGSRKVAHPPEQCYSGGGFEMEEISPDSFTTADARSIDAKRLVMVGRDGVQVVLYTYKVGDRYTGSFPKQQLLVMWSNLTLRAGTRVGLIRLSAPIGSIRGRDAGMALLKAFARDAFPEIDKALR